MNGNSNLELLMEKIFDDENTVNEIMKTDDMFALYELCQKVQGGYTFEEFTEFFEDLVCICLDEVEGVKKTLEENADEISKLEEKDLNNVSGGVRGTQRLASSVLASLMFVTSVGAASDSTPQIDAGTGEVRLRDASEEKAKQEAAQQGNKFLKWLDTSLDTVWDNKGKILLSSIALIGGGALLTAGGGDKLVDNIRELLKKREENKQFNHKIDVLASEERPKDFNEAEHTNLSDEEKSKIREKIGADQELWDTYHHKELEGINPATNQEYTEQEKENYKKTVGENRTAEIERLYNQIKRNEKDGIFGTLTKNLVTVGAISSILGGAGTALKELTGFVNKLAQTASDVKALRYYYDDGARTVEAWQGRLNIEVQKQQSKNYDPEEAEEYLRDAFGSLIRGQEKAKDQIMRFFTQFVADRKAAEIGASSSALPKPKVLVFNGPSGTGKTFMAGLLSKAITTVEPYVITASDILDASKSSPEYMSYAFFYGNTKKGGNAKDDMSSMDMSSLASFLKATEGTVRVVIVDEWDKLYKKDRKGNYPEMHALDETVRSIIDDRCKDYDGHNIDLSGTVFIFTTNETLASLQGRIKVNPYTGDFVEAMVDEEGDPVLDDSGKRVYGTPSKDKTGTQTLVAHDGSVMARLDGSICYFDKLSDDDYETIARDALGDDRDIKNLDDYANAGKPHKVGLETRLIHQIGGVIISDKGYKKIAEYAYNKNNGARAIVGAGGTDGGSVAGNLSSSINNYINFLKNTGKSYRDIILLAEPYEDKDSTRSKTIKFNIKAVGYDDYEKYLKEYKDK